MIRKFLICGKQVYLQNKKMESFNEIGTVVELIMPIEKFWEAEELMKTANYLLASGEPGSDVIAAYKKVFVLCAPFAVTEKERFWLYDKAKDKESS